MGWRTKIDKAKRQHRPSLKNWECDGIYETFPAFVQSVSSPDQDYQAFVLPRRNDGYSAEQLPVILDARDLTVEEFTSKYEASEIPCVIRGIPNGFDGAQWEGEWPAKAHWTLQALKHDERLCERRFKCGEDDDGYSVKVKLRHFLDYMEKNRDDSPLYVFCSSFEDDAQAKRILSDYRVPSYFRDDLFRYVKESRRPPYRWFLVGPERSGTTVHVDPLATSAWNTLITGRKRWVLFPPHVKKSVVKGKGLIRDDEDDEAVHYFTTILPRIKRKAGSLRDQKDYEDFAVYEFTQFPGETVFIPNGWWHAVLNLTDTTGVTQNYCSPRNFNKVWVKTRSGRKRMAWKWLGALETHEPELAKRARLLNERDNFGMKYDPNEKNGHKQGKK